MGISNRILNTEFKILNISELSKYIIYVHNSHCIFTDQLNFEVYFPLFNSNFIINKNTIYLDNAPFNNNIFLIKHSDVKLANSVRFPDYIDIVFKEEINNELFIFLETDQEDYTNTYSYLYEYDFIFM